MAHKTLIGGTAYEVSGGKTLIGGTGYSIAGGKTMIGGTGYDISFLNGIRASDIAVGSIVNLLENGTPVQYRVVHKGNPNSSIYDSSCDGVWLWRVPHFSYVSWGSNASRYNTSDLHTYTCTSVALGKFNSAEQALIKTVKIPYAQLGSIASGSSGLSTKIFVLSAIEVGAKYVSSDRIFQNLPTDGAKLSYFTSTNSANTKRKINSTVHWTRSKFLNGNTAYEIGSDGSIGSGGSTNTYNVRTALILDHSTLFDPETLTILV